ncbi:hypothetical protein [Pelagibaculum spongiae]|uniref:Uncharacterized protein n=1 Tax=Pelagibaculum spongiae TaxID=2080658 RepID=A0A2V1H0K4_9GAMM|nr:hypothetical protein [Pelagibaculum spongiae]PVZ68190.1 hypothetical protein DC094_12890 [Pelagibaculum spongiae]
MTEQKTKAAEDSSTVKSEPSSCQRELSEQEQQLRQGRRSMVMPMRGEATSKVRYVEGSMPLKNGCWLSD